MAKTRNFAEVIRKKLRDNASLDKRVAEETLNALVATEVFRVRTERGLTQTQLAKMIGTHQPVIARLEDADYGGHSLSMLNRIAESLGYKVQIAMVSQETAPLGEE